MNCRVNRLKTHLEWIDNLLPSDGGEDMRTDSHATMLGHLQHPQDHSLNTSLVLLATQMVLGLEGREGYRRCFQIWTRNFSKRKQYKIFLIIINQKEHTLALDLESCTAQLASKDPYDWSNTSQTISFAFSIHVSSHPAFLKYSSLCRGCKTSNILENKSYNNKIVLTHRDPVYVGVIGSVVVAVEGFFANCKCSLECER